MFRRTPFKKMISITTGTEIPEDFSSQGTWTISACFMNNNNNINNYGYNYTNNFIINNNTVCLDNFILGTLAPFHAPV